jgi:hypothetical protein
VQSYNSRSRPEGECEPEPDHGVLMTRHELSWNKAIHSAFEQVYDIPFKRDITDYKTAHSGKSTAQDLVQR